MTDIAITDMGDGQFGVQVTEGDTTTSHEVTVTEGFLDDLNFAETERERIVRETFGFLLDREPATSIMRSFSLDVVSRYFPDYVDELRTRLS